MVVGAGTALNVTTVLVGASVGVLLGHRLPQRTRDVVTDAIGLVTLLVAALSAADVTDPALRARVGNSAGVLIVLGSLLIGGILGSLLRIEDRLEGIGGWMRDRLGRHEGAGQSRERFVEGYVSASLIFCVGPLTILGSLSDGLGRGIDQLALKSVLDGFTAIAFAASLGWGVAASAATVAVVQGALTLTGFLLGDVFSDAQVLALTATGGLLLAGVGLRLLKIRQIPVGDLLPALVIAPLLVPLAAAFVH